MVCAAWPVTGWRAEKLTRSSSSRSALSSAARRYWARRSLPPGPAQLAMLGLGAFLCAASTGPTGAMVADLTPLAIHGTAFATLTLANNILGLAPGPILTGRLADRLGLLGALQLLPIPAFLAALSFAISRRTYTGDLATMVAKTA